LISQVRDAIPSRPRSVVERSSAFTLIELLVVTLIIGTLLGIAIPLYLSTVRNASVQAVKANLRMIGQAGQVYFVRDHHYPSSIDEIVGPGRDIETVGGPRGVTYDIDASSSPNGPFVVKAVEHGQDVFGSSGTGDTATFTLSSNMYTGLP
jgi:prepilin-type N-terminal cleavage/methylation domain-containing protein